MELKRPLITVITVVFNGAAHLEQAIRSVLDQSEEKIEYIIIDGGSTDGTLEIIRRYEDRIASWVSEKDNGIFDAMNKGIARATGEFIGFLNADDWYEPGILGQVANRVTANPGSPAGRVIYFNYYWWDEEFSTETRNPRQCNLKYWRGMSILHQAMFVQRKVYEELGPYNLEYRFASDYDYFLRLIAAGVGFEKIDGCGVNFRKGGASTQNMNRSISEVSKLVRMYFSTVSKEYALFLLTNRLPSLLGHLGNFLNKAIGKNKTVKVRKNWRRLIGTKHEAVEK